MNNPGSTPDFFRKVFEDRSNGYEKSDPTALEIGREDRAGRSGGRPIQRLRKIRSNGSGDRAGRSGGRREDRAGRQRPIQRAGIFDSLDLTVEEGLRV